MSIASYTGRDRRPTTRFLLLLLSLLSLSTACGNYVSYDAEGSTPAAVDIEQNPVVLEDAPMLTRVNHYALGGVLATHTSRDEAKGDVFVDYNALASDEEALYELERYAALLASIDPLMLESAEERFVYFINAYNVSVIRGVLERFEGDVEGFKVTESEGFFKDRLYTLGGETLSLDQIENLAIRGKFEDEAQTAGLEQETLAALQAWFEATWPDGKKVDARLHAALNCGALGCPNLYATGPYVYQTERLEEQLELATTSWLANAEKGAGPDGISMLFTWFEQDFVEDAGSVEAFIEAHREGGTSGVDLTDRLEYDWTLNAPENAP